MPTSVARANQRAHAYWYADGFGEILSGIWFVMIALVLAGRVWLADSFLAGLAGPVKDMLVVGGVVIVPLSINWLKARYTYPRTGRITYHRLSAKARWALVGWSLFGVIAVTAGLIGAFLLASGFRAWLLASFPAVLVLGCGLGMGMLLLGWAARTGLLRFIILGAFVSLLAFVLAAWDSQLGAQLTLPAELPVSPLAQLPADVGDFVAASMLRAYGGVSGLFGALGVAFVASGLLARQAYLRSTQLPAEDRA